jgi:pilus assembly protein Flp/PilA
MFSFLATIKLRALRGGIVQAWLKWIRRLFSSEDGQGLAEYALILLLIVILAIGALTAVGESILGLYELIEAMYP